MTDYSDFSLQHASGLNSEGNLVPDKLYDRFEVRRKVTIPSGQGIVARGSALGKITLGAATSAVKAAGANTGNGTLVLDVTTPILANARAGTYTVRFVTATSVQLLDPFGLSLGTYAIGGAATNSVTISDRVKFALTQGSTVFVVGDGFDITIAAGSGKWKLATAAATDGSSVIRGILLSSVDATSADVEGIIGRVGRANGNAVIFGAGITWAAVDDDLIDRGIFLETVFG